MAALVPLWAPPLPAAEQTANNLWPPLHPKIGVLDFLSGDSGKHVDFVIQHHARQPRIGRDLPDALNGIEDLSRARIFLDPTQEKGVGDPDRQMRLGDILSMTLLRNEKQVLQTALQYI